MPSSEATGVHAAIVYNPVKVPLGRLRRAVAAQEAHRGWGLTRWYATDRDDSGRRAAQSAVDDQPAVVMIAGGDGTVRAVAEVVHGSSTPVALLPFGTGNLLARNLGLPLADIDATVRTAFEGALRPVDVAVAELDDDAGNRSTQVFMVMAGIGLDAEMAKNTSVRVKKHLGWLAYVSPIARSIIANRLFNLCYRVDGGPIRSARAHTLIVGNCGTLTGKMLLLPSAVVDDGLLDVVMFRPKSWFGWAKIGSRLATHQIAQHSRFGRSIMHVTPDLKALAYAQGRRFEVQFAIPHSVQLDGDSFGRTVGACITIRPGALRVCVDAGAGAGAG